MNDERREPLYVDCADCGARYDRANLGEPIDGCDLCGHRGGPHHYAGTACRSGGLRHPDCPARGRRPHCTCDSCF
jgi:hypothetical protein